MKYFPQMVIGGETYKVKDQEAREAVEALNLPLEYYQTTSQVKNLSDHPVNINDTIYFIPVSASTEKIKGLTFIGKYVEEGVTKYDYLAEIVYFGETMCIKARRAYTSVQAQINPWDATASDRTFSFKIGIFSNADINTLHYTGADNDPKLFDGMRRYFAGSYSNAVQIDGPFAEGNDLYIRFVRYSLGAQLTGLIVRGNYYDDGGTQQTDTIIENAPIGELCGATLKRTYKRISVVGLPIVSDPAKFGFVFDLQCSKNSTVSDLFHLVQEKKQRNVPFTLVQNALSASTNPMKMSIPHAKRNYTISFDADISSENYGSIELYLGTNPDGQPVEKHTFSKLTVTGTELIVQYSPTSVTTETVEYTHGLTIAGRVSFMVHVLEPNNAEIILSSPGAGTATGTGLFRVQNVPWNECIGFRSYYPSEVRTPCLVVKALTGTYANCILKADAKDYERKIWAFGDSYFGLWPEYAIAYGYDDMALDAFGGRQAWEGWKSLELEAEKRTPKKIFWALGMNGGDTKGTGGNLDEVNAGWLAAFNNVKDYCERNDIELIISTIPTTPDPARYHEVKNAIIRASGCRVVDVAAAVGSNAETNYEWFPGLLGNDQIHPSLLGRQIIAAKVMTDIPELAEL